MKTRILMLVLALTICVSQAKSQWVVSDPTNFAQGIVNTTRNVVQTSKTASNMVSNFKETVKIYEQGV